MARMLPPVIDRSSPPGEVELFDQLRDDPVTSGWTVLHSLDIARHQSKVSGEIDFVCLVPDAGVVCLEVKSHRRIELDAAGRWLYGTPPAPGQDPFRQAGTAMYSLLRTVSEAEPDLGRVLFTSAVVFPAARLTQSGGPAVGWHPWQLADAARLQREGAGAIVRNVLSAARAHMASLPGKGGLAGPGSAPTAGDCERLAALMRPTFEFQQTPTERAQASDREVRTWTERQFRALDRLAGNDRVLLTGPAGTGKTLLAVEAARRAALDGERVLLLCFNRLAGQWLRRQADAINGPGQVTGGTLHQYLLGVTGGGVPEGAGPDYWQEALPEAAALRLMDGAPPFDRLVLDEGQDLMRSGYLDALDAALVGGLGAGRWTVFGDDLGQAIQRQVDPGLTTLSDGLGRAGGSFGRYALDENCRNVPGIGRIAGRIADLTPGYGDFLRAEVPDPARIVYHDSATGPGPQIEMALADLYRAGYTGEDIALLTTGKTLPPLSAPWDQRVRPVEADGRGYVRHATIHAFKGLEARAVVAAGFGGASTPEARDLLYVAMTRARDRLTVVAHESALPDLLQAALP